MPEGRPTNSLAELVKTETFVVFNEARCFGTHRNAETEISLLYYIATYGQILDI